LLEEFLLFRNRSLRLAQSRCCVVALKINEGPQMTILQSFERRADLNSESSFVIFSRCAQRSRSVARTLNDCSRSFAKLIRNRV
jgi:hypothetical protein